MSHRTFSLSDLLGRSPGDFFATTWERDALLSRATMAAHVHDLLTQDEFETLMAGAPGGRWSWLSTVDGFARPLAGEDGKPVPLAPIYRAYSAGVSLLLVDLQRRWAPIARLCRTLELEMLELGVPLARHLAANAYLTPASSRGLDVHYDHHCVLIVQLTGEKDWQVYRPTNDLPVDRCPGPISRDALGAVVIDASLGPGDVLYIPRGFPHAARTGASSSLHLTISIDTTTWLALLLDAAREHAAFRRSVPLVSAPNAARRRFDADLEPDLERLALDDVLRRHRLALLADLDPFPAGRLRQIDRLEEIGPDTPLTRVQGTPCTATVEDDQAVLRFPGATVRLHRAMEPVFTFIAEQQTLTAAQLPASAKYDALGLVKILVQEGLLQAVETPSTAAAASAGCAQEQR